MYIYNYIYIYISIYIYIYDIIYIYIYQTLLFAFERLYMLYQFFLVTANSDKSKNMAQTCVQVKAMSISYMTEDLMVHVRRLIAKASRVPTSVLTKVEFAAREVFFAEVSRKLDILNHHSTLQMHSTMQYNVVLCADMIMPLFLEQL